MAAKARSSEGCWTCRLRRKKCDEARPVCAACDALDISCLYSERKPAWMDNGPKQKDKADSIKAEVKRRAAWRRERRALQFIEAGVEDLTMTTAVPDSDGPGRDREHSGAALSEGPTMDESGESTRSPGAASASDGPASDYTHPSSVSGAPPAAAGGHHLVPPLPTQAPLALSSSYETELGFIMTYLDNVFPFLFPYYHPHILQSGRSWLLVLLLRNKPLFHAVLSLASYFGVVVLDGLESGHELCKTTNLAELQKQQELSLTELQSELKEINCRGVAGHLLESVRVMESIIQLLCLDIASGQTGNWHMHLDAAVELFDQIMWNHGRGVDGYCWHAVLVKLTSDDFFTSLSIAGKRPWNSDQAALRFFTSYLLYLDVVSSTVLERPPRLQRFHPVLLSGPEHEHSCGLSDGGRDGPQLQLEELVGIENWVMILIGRISELQAWKKEMKRLGSLSMVHLVSRATEVETHLRASIEVLKLRIQADPYAPGSSLRGHDPLDFVSQYRHSPLATSTDSTWVTQIWAQAALTYLSVVVSGWQPGSAEIRESVLTTTELLSNRPSAACLRSVVWPFCLTGCLATPCQEQMFRDMVSSMGALSAFGTIRQALALMEHAWQNREQVERAGNWDLAAALSSLGPPSLLV